MGLFVLPEELDLLNSEIDLIRGAIQLVLTVGQASVTTVAGNTRSYNMSNLNDLKTYLRQLQREKSAYNNTGPVWPRIGF